MTERMTAAEFGQIVTGTTGVLLLSLSGYGVANLRYRVPGTAWFVALTLSGAVWCLGYTVEKAQTLVDGFMGAARIEYIGLAFLAPFWLMLTLSWIEHPLARAWWFRVPILLISALVLMAVWTNPLHHWWYQTVVPTGRVGFARFQPGVLYYFGACLYIFSFAFSSILVLRRGRIPLFRRKAGVILAANAIPFVFALAFQFGFRPQGLDPTIFSLLPAFLVLGWGLYRHDFIRIVPIARELVVESLDQAVLVHDAQGRLVDHNKAARPLLSGLEESIRGTAEPQGEFKLTLPGGVRDFRYRRSLIQGPGNQTRGTVTILTDVTEEKHLLEELAHQASHDALTGVANRRHFEEHALGEITRAGRHGGTLALVLFDLDRFKSINDNFGHQAGDKVLKSVVATVSGRLRLYDLLARVGGEEFAVLMPQTNPVEAREAAERWRVALEKAPLALPGAVVPVTASFGVATLNDLPLALPNDGRIRLDALMGLADRALYQAKADGRNRVC